MNLVDYLHQEGITDLSGLSWDEAEKLIVPKKLAKYQMLVDEFCRYNIQDNITALYNYTAQERMDPFFESLLMNRTTSITPQILAELNGEKTVLDLGCNSGLKTTFYAMQKPQTQFTGVDISEIPLAQGENRAKRYRIQNVKYKKGDMLKISPADRFDCVIAEHSLFETHSYGLLGGYEDPMFREKFEQVSPVIERGKFIVVLTPYNFEEVAENLEEVAKATGFKSSQSIRIPYLKEGEKEKAILFIAKK